MTTTLERPADSAGALYYPTPVTPEEAFQAIGRLRKDARDEIDRLIQFLDKTDNYVSRELEDQVDDGPCDDNELDGPEHDEDEESDPAEPSLGSIERAEWTDQERWASSSTKDLEDEHDGAEPPEDSEPSLGWTLIGVIGSTSGSDCELDTCDRESNEPLLTECA